MKTLDKIKRFFKKTFPSETEVMVFYAPGRVNLLGEHTDYNGLPVLPFAINRKILFAVSPRNDNNVVAVSMDGYEKVQFEISDNIPKSGQGSWANYIKAAAEFLCRKEKKLYGFNAVVIGDIPQAAGLSSSSALVVVSGLVLSVINNLIIDRLILAENMAQAEMYTGTRGGGMDQAVSLLNKRGHALKIDFFPTRIKPVKIPEAYSVIVCNSLIKAEKSGNILKAFNLRSAECRLGILMINAFLRKTALPEITRLGDIPGRIEKFGFDNPERLLDTVFTKESYTVNEITEYCKKDIDGIKSIAAEFEFIDSFSIKKRCRHVLKEGERVNNGTEYLDAGMVKEFARLMNESHLSCRDDYEISCNEVNELVNMCIQSGAPGARITGAGFGGSVVCIVEKKNAKSFLAEIRKRYYEEYISDVHPELKDYNESIIICRSVDGAARLL
jgi:N-acetylgalactosamine kinase